MYSKHYTVILAIAATTSAFSQSGTLDGDFSADGMQYTLVGEYSAKGIDVALTPENYIVVVGEGYNSPSDNGIALAKYVPDGELDMSFGTGGKVLLEIGTGYDRCNGMLILPDGKIVIAGSTQSAGQPTSLLLARFMPDGSLDTDFDTDGMAMLTIDGISVEAYGMALQSDGKLVAVGSHFNGGDGALLVTRFNADGTLDAEYGTDGYALIDFGNNGRGVAVDAAGNAVVVGQTFSAGQQQLLARFSPEGVLDVTFDSDGYVIGTSTGGSANTVLVNEERIYVGGSIGTDLSVSAYNADGTADGTWGVAGVATLAATDLSTEAYGMAWQADGKLVVCGKALGDNSDMLLGRFTADGTPDATFGTDGMVINTEASPTGGSFGYGVAVQPDYRIVVAGQAFENSSNNIFVARYLSGINVGVAEFTANTGLLLYPNPVAEQATFTYELRTAERLTCTLVDAQGRTVSTVFANGERAAGKHTVPVDMRGLAEGPYTILLSNATGSTALRVVKH